MDNERIIRLLRAAAVVQDGPARQAQYVREFAEANPAARPMATPEPVAPPQPAARPAGGDAVKRDIRRDYYDDLLEFAKQIYPTEVSLSGRSAAESLVSSVFASFVQGQLSGIEALQAQGDLWPLLVEIALVKVERRRQAPTILPFPQVESSRTFAAALGETCREFIEGSGDEFERQVALLNMQRHNPEQIASTLDEPEATVAAALDNVRRKLTNQLERLRAAG